MNRTVALAAAAALGITGALVAFAPSALGPGSAAPDAARSAWTEVQWPFPKDPWGRGRAFRCGPADCAAEVNLYLRAKLGFCNCVTGIADDADLDGMGDVALVGGAAAPLGDGRPVAIGWMKGRVRAYARADRQDETVLSVAFNDRCDMVVATIVLPRDRLAAVEPDVIAFLNSETVLNWTRMTLGI
jgi:hypothetical protein